MNRVAATLALGLLALAGACAAIPQDRVLAAPPSMTGQSRLVLQVEVGPLAKGDEVSVTTADGHDLGTISPYGIRSGQAAGTYSIPVPSSLLRRDGLHLRLRILRAGSAPRVPTPTEIIGVRLQATD